MAINHKKRSRAFIYPRHEVYDEALIAARSIGISFARIAEIALESWISERKRANIERLRQASDQIK